MRSGMFVFTAIERMVYGQPAAQALHAEADRLQANRVFLIVSGTMNRMTDEVAKVRQALGTRCAGLGLAGRLADVGIMREQFATIAAHAMHESWLHTNPRKITSSEQVPKILDAAA